MEVGFKSNGGHYLCRPTPHAFRRAAVKNDFLTFGVG